MNVLNNTGPSHAFTPLTRNNLEQVWKWRNSPRVRINMHNEQLIEWQAHLAWFEALQSDSSRECWVYNQHERPVGVLNFSAINSATPDWGCYLGETDVLPGSGLILEWAALEYFTAQPESLNLNAEVLSFNEAAIKLHKLFGYQQIKVEKGGKRKLTDDDAMQAYDVHHFLYARSDWCNNRNTVLAKLPKPLQKVMQQIQFLHEELG